MGPSIKSVDERETGVVLPAADIEVTTTDTGIGRADHETRGGPAMSTPSVDATLWPLVDLVLVTGDLTLRPMAEADLTPLAELLPDDVDQNPALPSFGGRSVRSTRGTTLCQTYWHSVGTWRAESWNLQFVVRAGGEPVGVQSLEADDFAARRTADSSSWLATSARGRGLGKAMRLAVLALAFDGLGAGVAETSAWHDNAASIGVSRALGYVDNGVRRHSDRGRVDDMVHMRLTRDVWQARHAVHGVSVLGLAPCLPFFGLG
jgi:RimJ/RimL family protein N-acetyltransferase